MPRKTFSATDSAGAIDSSWAIRTIPRVIASRGEWNVTGSPSISSCPRSGAMTPARILPSVDFPAPFSPTSAWIDPLATVRLISSRARTPPKDLLMSTSSTCVPFAFALGLLGHLSPATRR